MKLIKSSQSKPPVTIEFTHEEAELLFDLAGYDRTIVEAMHRNGYWKNEDKTLQGRNLLQSLRTVLLEME